MSKTASKTSLTRTTNAARAAAAKAGDTATSAAKSVRERGERAIDAGAETFDSYPLAAAFGAVALGAVAAALLPASAGERRALGDLGTTLRGSARGMARNARNVGMDELEELGLSSTALKAALGTIGGAFARAIIANLLDGSSRPSKRSKSATR